MKHPATTILTALLICPLITVQAQQALQPPDPDTSGWINENTNCMVITSRRLTLDQEQHVAVFEENVLVTDKDMTLSADKMTVRMSPSNTIESIRAEGRVHAVQKDRVAIARQADYDAIEDKIVITGDPKLQQGNDYLKGDTITFWRGNNRVVCEPNATMVIHPQPEHDQIKKPLFGAAPDD